MGINLPIDGDGVCMACKSIPPKPDSATCRTCAAPWHVSCLSSPPATPGPLFSDWLCPDCIGGDFVDGGTSAPPMSLVARIRAIEEDMSLTESERARQRQDLLLMDSRIDALSSSSSCSEDDDDDDDVLHLLDDKFNCSFCMQLPDRPVTTPCGHNFCLKCFQKWIGKGKRSCVKCRTHIPPKIASRPRINSALVSAIRMARTAKKMSSTSNSKTPYHFIDNENRPDTAFTTERAKRAGKANACSGQIFVTIAPDHFGPILAVHDPKRNRGVLVGESWEDRLECRQWGVHFPHVAGVAGQSTYGAQSVVFSGGYEDDEDHGEWFLYTGSGGKDLSGNKRTNKYQSFDQKFAKYNEALRLSCKMGYPVRVVRSHKAKRSSYAPETGVRYDGVYRIEMCWRIVGSQGFKVCRFLFVRCDNEPAPWTCDEEGDRPRPLPAIKELRRATDVTKRKRSPAWDYDEQGGWKWTKSPPESRKALTTGNPEEGKRGHNSRKPTPGTMKDKLLKEFTCQICRKVMTLPLTTPCAHNFCKLCLLEAYDNQPFIRERTCGWKTLRVHMVVKKCPSCPNDISDFIQNPKVNREMLDLIESLQKKIKEENDENCSGEESDLEDSGAPESTDDKLSGEETSDDDEMLESADGDSEMEEGCEQDSKSLVKNTCIQVYVKRKRESEKTTTQVYCRQKQKAEEKSSGIQVYCRRKKISENATTLVYSRRKKISEKNTNIQVYCRRKRTIENGIASKKAKMCVEVGDIVKDTDEDQKKDDVGESSPANHVNCDHDVGDNGHRITEEEGSSKMLPCSQSRMQNVLS